LGPTGAQQTVFRCTRRSSWPCACWASHGLMRTWKRCPRSLLAECAHANMTAPRGVRAHPLTHSFAQHARACIGHATARAQEVTCRLQFAEEAKTRGNDLYRCNASVIVNANGRRRSRDSSIRVRVCTHAVKHPASECSHYVSDKQTLTHPVINKPSFTPQRTLQPLTQPAHASALQHVANHNSNNNN